MGATLAALRGAILTPLLLSLLSPSLAAPPFPIVADGTYCFEPDANCGDPPSSWYPWRWILYADGTFDESSDPILPSPTGTGSAGTWSFSAPTVTLVSTVDSWGYVGTLAGDCASGPWADLPHDGVREGLWTACISP